MSPIHIEPLPSSRRATASRPGPLHVAGLVLVLAFVIEAVIMLVYALWEGLTTRAVLLSFVDASVLSAVFAPVLWLVVVRPLRLLFEQRGALLARVLEIQEQERARLSRELHDELGQTLTVLLLTLRTIEQAPHPDRVAEGSRAARELVSDALNAVRRIARGLSPAVLVDLGLRQASERLIETVLNGTGITVAADFRLPERRLNPGVEIAAYRVLQEALTNIARHSGATRAEIGLALSGRVLELTVRDNGRGFDTARGQQASPGGIGLAGMRERVELLSGEFEVHSSAAGTGITARFPGALADDESDARPDR